MSHYRLCPYCGAHIDAGGLCNCTWSTYYRLSAEDRQAVSDKIHELATKKKTALDATNIQDGKEAQQGN